ncbi:pseudouridine synthase [Paraphysoderma sedebokerense]|nr:pseudouridine synthase [Paraphysoderma sedebokerense]
MSQSEKTSHIEDSIIHSTKSLQSHTFTFRKDHWPDDRPPQTKTLEIYYHNDELMIINKPFDFIIDGDEWSVQQCLQRLYPEYPRFHLIHQIDYGTSGIQCLGLTKQMTASVGKMFANRKVKKEYVAMVRGWIKEDRLDIDAPIAPDPLVKTRMCVGSVGNGGKNAQTSVYVTKRGYYTPPKSSEIVYIPPISRPNSTIKEIDQSSIPSAIPVSIVRLHLHTGRRHQLRVHLSHIGHPIVGDELYEPSPPSNLFSSSLSCPGNAASESTQSTQTEWPYEWTWTACRMYLHSRYIYIPLSERI